MGDRNDPILCRTIAILHQDDLKKRMNIKTVTWRNGCSGKMDDHPIHTTPNHHPSKMNVLPKTFLQIILAAKCKWLVQPLSTSLNQQPRPLPSLLYLSFFYGMLTSRDGECAILGSLISTLYQRQHGQTKGKTWVGKSLRFESQGWKTLGDHVLILKVFI